jgi:hypothetical protein
MFKTEGMNYAEIQLLLCSEEMSRVLPPQTMKLKTSVSVEKGSCEVVIMIR